MSLDGWLIWTGSTYLIKMNLKIPSSRITVLRQKTGYSYNTTPILDAMILRSIEQIIIPWYKYYPCIKDSYFYQNNYVRMSF